MIWFLLFSSVSFADRPTGFLWYNIEKEAKKTRPRGTPFTQLSFTQRDAVLRFYTMEALHKARHTQKMEDMRVFLSLQDYWLKESTRFKALFQKTMLAYPEYDYSVTHPTSNLGAKVTDEVREGRQTQILDALSKSHGLLFFYRGNSPYDMKQIPIIKDFSQRFHLPLIPVSVDGITSQELKQSRVDNGQANHLGVRYFPALLLVNTKNQKVAPVSYGLTTQDVLMGRVVQVITQFKGDA